MEKCPAQCLGALLTSLLSESEIITQVRVFRADRAFDVDSFATLRESLMKNENLTDSERVSILTEALDSSSAEPLNLLMLETLRGMSKISDYNLLAEQNFSNHPDSFKSLVHFSKAVLVYGLESKISLE